MTTAIILRGLVGLLLCAVIFTVVSLLIMGITWYLFRNGLDLDDIADEAEPEETEEP